jgi:hypothetical protein
MAKAICALSVLALSNVSAQPYPNPLNETNETELILVFGAPVLTTFALTVPDFESFAVSESQLKSVLGNVPSNLEVVVSLKYKLGVELRFTGGNASDLLTEAHARSALAASLHVDESKVMASIKHIPAPLEAGVGRRLQLAGSTASTTIECEIVTMDRTKAISINTALSNSVGKQPAMSDTQFIKDFLNNYGDSLQAPSVSTPVATVEASIEVIQISFSNESLGFQIPSAQDFQTNLINNYNATIDQIITTVDNGVVSTSAPTSSPTSVPTTSPTSTPTLGPSLTPTSMPTIAPTSVPTIAPTQRPTIEPTIAPTSTPPIVP